MSSLRTDLFRLTQRRLEDEYTRRSKVCDSKIETIDFSKICRICLSDETLHPISALSFQKKTFKELLEFAVCTEIKEDDNLPSNVCLKCYSDVVIAFVVKELGQRNESFLKSFLSSASLVYKEENEVYNMEEEEYEYGANEMPEETLEDTPDNNEEKLGDGYYLVFDEMDNLLQTSLDSSEENENIVNNVTEENSNDVIINLPKKKIKSGNGIDDHTYSRVAKVSANADVKDKLVKNEVTGSEVQTFEGAYIEQIKKAMALQNKEQNQDEIKTEIIEPENQEDYEYIEENEVVVESNEDQEQELYENYTQELELSDDNSEILHVKLLPELTTEAKTQSKIWYGCKICEQYFPHIALLKRHIKTHISDKQYFCDVCGEGFAQNSTFIEHIKQHRLDSEEENVPVKKPSDPVQSVCKICDITFSSRYEFRSHRAQMHKDKNFLCQICGKMFATNTSLQSHNKAVHSEEKSQCELCHKTFSSYGNLKLHYSRHHSDAKRPFKCTSCAKSFVTQADLKFHMQVHSGEKNFICQVCGKGFRLKTSYNSHILIHTGERPHQCKICFRRFVQPTHLNYHSLTHTGERPHACQYCGKTFALKGNLTVHIRTHTGERPYVCDVCNKGFYDSSSMKKHRKGHHGEDLVVPAVLSIVGDENNES